MQDTNLKISPYFDDFDRSKNYQKVLFKPGYSVQTRELNTLQSILQNQIERFGQHVFKEGSVVIPGNVGFSLEYKAVLIQNLVNGISVETYRENLVGSVITGLSSGVKAEIVSTLSQSESEKDTITFYVKYIGGGIIEDGKQAIKFKNNEVLVDQFGTPVAVTTVQNATDYTGSIAYIASGVYFIRGFFVEVLEQNIILDQYSNTPSYKIGLLVTESIETSEEDESLFDNALGTTNYAAPGADRLKISTTLAKQNLSTTENSSFIELLRLENGNPVKLVQNSIYSELEKNLARRTFDESGSYTLREYDVKVRDTISDGENNGVYLTNQKTYEGKIVLNRNPTTTETDSINGNDYYTIEVSEGKSYVKGFEVNNQQKQYITIPRPRKSSSVNNQGLFLSIGSYLKLDDTAAGYGKFNPGDTLLLYDTDNQNIGELVGLTITQPYFIYFVDLTIYTKITLDSSSHGLQEGDLVTGNSSGAKGFVHSVSTSDVTLRQITGSFLSGEKISSSRSDYTTNPEISSVQSYKLENVRTVKKISGTTTSFLGTIKLDELIISGSSFTVSSGTTLTGINTRFSSELYPESKVRVGNEIVEVSSVTSSTVTLSTSITNGTYYNVSKLVCKIYSSSSGLTVKSSSFPVKKSKDYAYDVSVVKTVSVAADETARISQNTTETIDSTSIIAFSSTEILNPTITQTSNNVVDLSDLGSISSVNVYYKYRVATDSVRKKTSKKYQKLIVDLAKNSTNTKYGTRLSDAEWSLKFPDVYNIHCVREAYNENDANSLLFDSITVNDSGNLSVGDVLVVNSTRAKIIEKVSGSNELKVIYLSNSKLSSGENLAISLTVATNDSAVGIYVTSVKDGLYKDITEDYSLVKNDTEDCYRVSKLVRKLNRSSPKNKVIVVFDYLEHTQLTSDLYTVESYSDVDMKYQDIPLSYDFTPYTDIVDFRFYVTPSTSGSGTLTSPHKETNSALDYKNNTIQNISSRLASPREIFSHDYEFYVGRIDNVYLTETGEATVITGSQSINPKPPENDNIGLLLATITIPPYFKKISDASVTFEKNKGYTMRDIGKLESRLESVEKYTSLSLLEVNTNTLNILDEDGKNRFKNGFLVDKFNSLGVADLTNTDYSASIDVDNYLLRPYPYVNNVGLNFNSTNSTAKKTGDIITIPYEEVTYISQDYSSRVENLQPFEVFNWTGRLQLSPHKDVWYDTWRIPAEPQVLDLEQPIRFLFEQSGASGDQWGSWRTTGSSRGNGGTNIDQTRTGVNNSLSVTTTTLNTGDTLDQITDIKYARSVIIRLYGDSLKPNTAFGLHINDKDANDVFIPALITNISGVTKKFIVGETVTIFRSVESTAWSGLPDILFATVVAPTEYSELTYSNFTQYSVNTSYLAISDLRSSDNGLVYNGDFLFGPTVIIEGNSSGARGTFTLGYGSVRSNEYGEVNGFVVIPEQTFETGTLEFTITDRSDNIVAEGVSESSASTNFYSQGTFMLYTSNITSVEVPEIITTPISETRRLFQPDPPPAAHDPIAQSFFVDTENGIFVTSIDLYFYLKDPTASIEVTIRTVENGNPTETIVPYARATVRAQDVKVSNDASIPTKFTFPSPVYLSDKTDYCFVVFSQTTKSYIWVSRLGEDDVTTNLKIDKQPYVGVLLKSANKVTWASDQFQDIKFRLNRAKFTTNTTFNALLNNTPIQKSKLKKNSLKFVNNTEKITVFHPNHGMHSTSNYVRIGGVVSDTAYAILSAQLTVSGTSLTVNNISGQSFNAYTDGFWSKINNANISDTNPGLLKIGSEILSYTGITNNQFTGLLRGQLGTTAVQHPVGSRVECYNVNGVPLNEINALHKINKVISLDEYEILTTSKSNSNLRFAGTSAYATKNIQFEIIQPSINEITLPSTSLELSMNSVTGTSIGNTTQTSFTVISGENIQNGVETDLASPRIIPSTENMSRYLPNMSGGIEVNVNLSTTTDTLSPILDVSGSSILAITNRINKEVTDDLTQTLDISSELLPVGGLHSSYITKKVSLENSSTSLKVYFDAVRRSGVDIKVFAKVKGDSNLGSFSSMNYIEIPSISYPSSQTKDDYRGFEYELNGIQSFKEWSIKIVMISNDQTNIPLIKNFRAIALAL